jgi:Kdo2-lipid IVA lauroyltransferase/acyltransferase
MRLFLFNFFMRLFAAMPLPVNHAFGSMLGVLMVLFRSKLHTIVVENIQRCYPSMSEADKKQFIADTLKESGKTITEMGPMWRWSDEKILATVKQVSGKQYLDEAIAKGKGVILAIPHLGAWEQVGLYCANLYPMTSLYKPPKLKAIDPVIRNARQRTGAKLVPTDSKGVKSLFVALKKAEMVAILPDQEPKNGTGAFAPFMNNPAYTMVLLSRLVQKRQSTVLFSFAERLPDGMGFHLHFLPADEAIYSQNLEESITAMNQGVERCITHCPAQYQWSYKRFRRQPEPL